MRDESNQCLHYFLIEKKGNHTRVIYNFTNSKSELLQYSVKKSQHNDFRNKVPSNPLISIAGFITVPSFGLLLPVSIPIAALGGVSYAVESVVYASLKKDKQIIEEMFAGENVEVSQRIMNRFINSVAFTVETGHTKKWVRNRLPNRNWYWANYN